MTSFSRLLFWIFFLRKTVLISVYLISEFISTYKIPVIIFLSFLFPVMFFFHIVKSQWTFTGAGSVMKKPELKKKIGRAKNSSWQITKHFRDRKCISQCFYIGSLHLQWNIVLNQIPGCWVPMTELFSVSIRFNIEENEKIKWRFKHLT